jgi:hypothetical protein
MAACSSSASRIKRVPRAMWKNVTACSSCVGSVEPLLLQKRLGCAQACCPHDPCPEAGGLTAGREKEGRRAGQSLPNSCLDPAHPSMASPEQSQSPGFSRNRVSLASAHRAMGRSAHLSYATAYAGLAPRQLTTWRGHRPAVRSRIRSLCGRDNVLRTERTSGHFT